MRAHTRKHHIDKTSHQEDDKPMSIEEFHKEAFGNKPEWAVLFRGLRYKEELTQVEMGTLTGLSQTTISDIERGRRPIGKKLAKKIAEIFKTDYRLFL